MAENRLHIGGSGPFSHEEVARRGFATARRGFDQGEVRSFLNGVAAELRRLEERIAELEQAADSAPPPPEPPPLDVATLTAALGEETARVLRAAQEAAADLRTRAEESAARVLNEAHEEAARIRGSAEGLLAKRTEEADTLAARLRAEVESEVESLRSRTVAESEAIVEAAKDQGRHMVTEAQAARERMLTDLARRRKAALIQLEQLRAGRERLLEAYRAVRHSLDDITTELERAGDEARAAANAAGRKPLPPEPDVETLVAQAAAEAAADVAADVAAAEAAPDVEEPPAPPEPPAPSEPVPAAESPPPPPVELGPGDAMPVATLPDTAVGEAESEEAGVEELFARLRADRAEAVAHAHEVLEEAAVVTETETEARVSTDDEQYLHRRDELIEPVVSNLTRRAKRLLQDEQNLLLDRLRTHRGPIKADALLPDSAAHLVPYVEAAMTALGDAEAAGAQLAGGASADGSPDHAELGALASTLAADIVEPLRRRLQEVLDRAEDPAAVADSVNAAYRETKSRRIDRAIGDQVTAAVTLGLRRAIPERSPVHWLVDDADGPCPDCDDNALAGPTPLGETFPTGQTGPPAHPGCRCLLRPASA